MRTTIRMNKELARRAKEFASRHRRTFTQLIEDAVTDYLARQARSPARKPIVLPVGGDPRHKVTPEELKKVVEEADLEYDLKKIGGA
jgi:hypothetical protein